MNAFLSLTHWCDFDDSTSIKHVKIEGEKYKDFQNWKGRVLKTSVLVCTHFDSQTECLWW